DEITVGGALRLLDDFAVTRAQSDGHARETELAFLDLAWHAAAGLEVAPDDADDRACLRLRIDRLRRALRHVGRRDPGDAQVGVATGLQGRLEQEAAALRHDG